MRRILNKRIGVAAIILVAGSLWLQSCSTAKGCGCGTNINQVYKSPKRYH